MDIDVKQFKENALSHGLCSEFTEIWNNCHSKKQIMDMMLGSKGIDFTADAIAKGWGISPSRLNEDYGRFKNGRYVRDIDGYTSKFYCQYEGEIEGDTTMILLVDSNSSVNIPQNNICEIYCTGKNRIRVSGEGECVFVCYGNPNDTEIVGGCRNMKRLNKKERDRYE